MILTAIYDLAVSPPTYDVAAFLVAAEMHRKAIGADGIDLYVVPGPDNGFRRDSLPPRDPAARRQMRDRIVVPMARMLPSVRSAVVLDGRDVPLEGPIFPKEWGPTNPVRCYGFDVQVRGFKAGCFPLKARRRMEKDAGLITFSLRESHYWPTRNARREEWIKLGRRLMAEGYRVGIIPDVDAPPLIEPGFTVFHSAGYDLDERAALYEAAELNLFTGSGPMAMAMLMAEAKCLVFRMTSPGAVCCDDRFFEGIGFKKGSQIGRFGHRIVWEDDTAEVMTGAVLQWFEEMAYG